MNDLKERLTTVILGYGCNDRLKAEDMAKYLMEAIDELKTLKRTIGSKVKIRRNLVPGNLYNGTGFEEEMLQYIGMEAKIVDFEHEEDCPPAYLLDVDNGFWSWSDDMLEDVE